MVALTVGTTATCAADDVEKIGQICQKEGLYLHGGPFTARSLTYPLILGAFAFCDEFKYLVNGLKYVDSYNTDLHKAGMINFDCCPLWFKNGTYASRYYNVDPVYLAHEYQSSNMDYRVSLCIVY